MTSEDRFAPFRSDVLFLLVGANPLPNYVAARLLAEEGGLVVLFPTSTTQSIAADLASHIGKARPSLRLDCRDIHRADAEVIRDRLGQAVKELAIRPGRFGLHYTGGTKPMAVHAYHYLRDKFRAGCFSYLDAETLDLFVERAGDRLQRIATADALQVGLEDLFALHGYYLMKTPLRKEPRAPDLCQAIVQVQRSEAGRQQWRQWYKTLGGAGTLPDPVKYPALGPFRDAAERIAAGREPAEDAVAEAVGVPDFQGCRAFASGGWLEEYALQALVDVSGPMKVHDWGINVRPLLEADRDKAFDEQRRDFELDVAGMSGYQLFAMSCMASDRVAKTKEHLLEVFVRARQVGGDEARVALVCQVRNAALLQREIEREEEEARGKVRVFGQRDLPGLAGRLRAWIRTANQEEA